MPLLPHQNVVQVFETITANIDDQVPAIGELINYVRATWVESSYTLTYINLHIKYGSNPIRIF